MEKRSAFSGHTGPRARSKGPSRDVGGQDVIATDDLSLADIGSIDGPLDARPYFETCFEMS